MLFSVTNCYASCDENYANKIAGVVQKEKEKLSEYTITQIPTSVVVAQNILESECGSSKAAKRKLNYYGLTAKSGKLMRFKSLEHSTQYYLRNISTHKAYKDVRRKIENGASYRNIVKSLSRRYAEDREYAEKIIDLVDMYDLQRFDETQLRIASRNWWVKNPLFQGVLFYKLFIFFLKSS